MNDPISYMNNIINNAENNCMQNIQDQTTCIVFDGVFPDNANDRKAEIFNELLKPFIVPLEVIK